MRDFPRFETSAKQKLKPFSGEYVVYVMIQAMVSKHACLFEITSTPSVPNHSSLCLCTKSNFSNFDQVFTKIC